MSKHQADAPHSKRWRYLADNLRFFWKQFRKTFVVVIVSGFIVGVAAGAISTYLVVAPPAAPADASVD